MSLPNAVGRKEKLCNVDDGDEWHKLTFTFVTQGTIHLVLAVGSLFGLCCSKFIFSQYRAMIGTTLNYHFNIT